MENNQIRDRIIQLAMCGTLTPKQLLLAAERIRKDPFLSLEKLLLGKNLLLNQPQAFALLERTRERENLLESQQLYREYKRLNVHFSTIYDPDYPAELREVYQPPVVLFYQGNWELTCKRRLGVVGSRKNTPYGTQVLSQFVPELVQKDVCIISGLAAGIDREAHVQTLTAGGSTIAVVGTGLNQTYPRSNQQLQKRIGQEQLLLSEYPLGTPPARYHFPMRNRIIAGLSQGVLVIEAKEKSGSLITANVALQENREVFAVPGSILEGSSKGTNQLIQAGAKLVMEPQDIYQEMNFLWKL